MTGRAHTRTEPHFHRYAKISMRGGPAYPTSDHLRYSVDWLRPVLLARADQVWDVILALREGITRPRSRFKIPGIGPIGYNDVVDWLGRCGYPVEGLKLPLKPKKTRR